MAGAKRPLFRFVRNKYASDLTYTVEASDSLSPASWAPVTAMNGGGEWSGSGTVEETAVSSTRTQVTVHDTRMLAAGARRFMRVRVTNP